MKKLMILAILLIAVLAMPALGEEADAAQPTQEPMITVPFNNDGDENPGLIISSLESDAAVRVLGVESEAVICAWETFQNAFTRFMKNNFDFDAAFTGPYYSDGYWAYIFTDGINNIRIRAVGAQAEAPVAEILVMGEMDAVEDVGILSAACMYSVAHCGQMGQFAMNLLFYGEGIDAYVKKGNDYWLENGFQLSFGHTDFDVPFGRIAYQETLEQETGPSFGLDIPPIENGPSLTDFTGYIEKNASIFGLTAPEIPEEAETANGFLLHSFLWEDCPVILLVRPENGTIAHATIASLSDDTISLWARTVLLYAAACQAEGDDFLALSLLNGSSASWDALCELKPYAWFQGVSLQCFNDDTFDGHLFAIIAGADVPDLDADSE